MNGAALNQGMLLVRPPGEPQDGDAGHDWVDQPIPGGAALGIDPSLFRQVPVSSSGGEHLDHEQGGATMARSVTASGAATSKSGSGTWPGPIRHATGATKVWRPSGRAAWRNSTNSSPTTRWWLVSGGGVMTRAPSSTSYRLPSSGVARRSSRYRGRSMTVFTPPGWHGFREGRVESLDVIRCSESEPEQR